MLFRSKITLKVKSDVKKSSANITIGGNLTVLNGEGSSDIVKVDPVTVKVNIKSTDNTLKNLTINDKAVSNFNSNTYTYSMQVDASTSKVKIGATLNSATATFEKGFGPRNVDLEYGDNSLVIKAKSEAGEVKEYTVTVNRIDGRDANNYLKNIIINKGKIKIDFDKETTRYEIKTYKLENIDISADCEDAEKAKVKADNPEFVAESTCTVNTIAKLDIGVKTIKITVTSESKIDRVYTLVIDNVDEEINTTLRILSIEGYNINFSPKVLDYEIEYNAKYKDGLDIIYSTFDESKGVKIEESLVAATNKDLKPGSVVKIRVYYDEEHESIYTITILGDNRINFFLILGLLVIVILTVVLIRVIKMRKKEQQIENKLEELVKTKEMKIEKNYKE